MKDVPILLLDIALALLLAWSFPGPTLIPTEDDFCPEYATLDAYHLEDKAVYVCTAETGQILWQRWWCGPVPQPAAQITAPLCLPDGVVWNDPRQGLPHFHCEPGRLHWHMQCRTLAGQLLWEVPLD